MPPSGWHVARQVFRVAAAAVVNFAWLVWVAGWAACISSPMAHCLWSRGFEALYAPEPCWWGARDAWVGGGPVGRGKGAWLQLVLTQPRKFERALALDWDDDCRLWNSAFAAADAFWKHDFTPAAYAGGTIPAADKHA